MKMEGTPEGELHAWIDTLRAGGVQLWEDAGVLRFRAPEGVMTDALRVQLRARRESLIAHLARADEGALVPEPAAAFVPFPLTDVQASYLVGRRPGVPFGDVGAHAYVEYALPRVDPRVVEPALAQLIARHSALRTIYHHEGQEVLAAVPAVPVTVHDLRALEEVRREARLASVRETLGQRCYDPAHWPQFSLEVSVWEHGLRLHFSIDLLVADFAGVQQLLQELSELCVARKELPAPPAISFRDYVLATQRLAKGARAERAEAYWAARSSTLPPPPELPVIAKSASDQGRFRRLEERLDEGTAAAMRRRAANANLPLSSVFLAAYADVMARWSAKSRFTLNVPVFAKQPLHPELDAVVGDFTSVTLLAVEPMPGATFVMRAKALGDRLLEDLEHASVSGVRVLKERRSKTGDLSSALMPVVFTSTLSTGSTQRVPAGHGKIVYGATQTPQVWIDCQVMEVGAEIMVSWDVREGVLPEGFCEAAFSALVGLLRALAISDGPWHASDPVRLPDEQRARRTADAVLSRVVADDSLHRRVLQKIAEQPAREAVITSGASLTFGALGRRAHAVARAVRRSGVGQGARVAVIMDKGWEQAVAVLGIGIAGATYVPIDTVHPAPRRASMLSAAGCAAVLTRSSQRALTDGVGLPVLLVDELEEGEPQSACSVSADDAAYVIFTSGSTGTPKGVVISHRAVCNTLDDIVRRYDVGPQDRVLGLAQLGFDLSVFDIFGVLGAGGTLVLPDADRRADPSHWLTLIEAHGVTLWNSVPAQLQMLQEHREATAASDQALASLRLVLLSGDWIPVDLPDRVRRGLPGLTMISLGGATEAAIWSIAHRIPSPVDGARPSIPYGRALTDQTFLVLDDELRERPDWVPGELYIGGSGLATGYLDAAQTRERFIEHPRTGERLYRTGDLGRWLPGGEIEFLGRRDLQVKLRGHRVELGEIEHALQADPTIGAAHVVAVGDGLHKRLVGFVQAARRERDATCDVALADLARRLRDVGASMPAAQVTTFVSALENAARASMLAALRAGGLFEEASRWHGAEEAARLAVPRHARVMERWLAALHRAGWLESNGVAYRLCPGRPFPSPREAWEELALTWDEKLGDRALYAYLRDHADQLADIMHGKAEPAHLLFPAGDFTRAEAAYATHAMARYLNQIVTALVVETAGSLGRPIRVLELGAGTGATSRAVWAGLGERPYEYVFSDVGAFFLERARTEFGVDARVRFQRVDIDAGFRAQGVDDFSFDVVIAAGVLDNARDIAATLREIRAALRSRGVLILTEPTCEHDEILISQAFMMAESLDVRRETNTTFLDRAAWQEQLHAHGGRLEVCLPEASHPLSPLGQHVMCARFHEDVCEIDVQQLRGRLREQLPDYMIPQRLVPVHAVPLSENGKIDRTELCAWAAQAAETGPSAAPLEPATDLLERALCDVFAASFSGGALSPVANLFEIGADSLVLAQVAANVIERIPEATGQHFDAVLRELLNRPTLRDLATFLRCTGRQAQPSSGLARAAGALWLEGAPSGDEDDDLNVLVHEGIGTMAPYRALASSLADRRGWLGLVVDDAQAYLRIPAEHLVAQLAAEHVRILLATKRRRFRLAGYCLGGQLAAEIARQLGDEGMWVERLTVISSSPPAFAVADDLLIEHAFGKVLGVDLARAGYVSDDEALGRALRAVLADTPEVVGPDAIARLDDRAHDGIPSTFARLAARPQSERLRALTATCYEGEHAAVLYPIFRHAFAAASLHRSAPYAGDITVVRPRDRLRFLVGFDRDAEAYWRDVCLGELKVIDVPGDHFGCMRVPAVRDVLRAVKGSP